MIYNVIRPETVTHYTSVFDAVTGEELAGVVYVDTETHELHRIELDEFGVPVPGLYHRFRLISEVRRVIVVEEGPIKRGTYATQYHSPYPGYSARAIDVLTGEGIADCIEADEEAGLVVHLVRDRHGDIRLDLMGQPVQRTTERRIRLEPCRRLSFPAN